ncbi:sulfotransferase, partial [Candidatus Pelagibacter sp.]|nr:sulfotransferase [Candidatus Pelagibacter sp.]
MSIVLKYLKLQENHQKIFRLISEVESFIFRINKLKIDQNIFVCGMPRSGTTFFTHLINSSNEFSTFKYKDLPFYTIPIFWKYFSGIFYGNKKKIQRSHGDNLLIDKFSPDAFEELIWKNYLSDYSENGYWQYIDDNNLSNIDKILEFYIKKLIYINKKNKYLSKNNNNIFRIKYILSKFPNSKIVLILRNPIDTSLSLAKVHQRFLKLHNLNNKFSEELKLLG